MYTRALQARRMCLLPIDDRGDMDGEGGLEERHVALLELGVTLFCTTILRENQDQSAKAVVCYEEAL